MLYIAWKRGLPRKFARFVLFRPIKKRSFNLLHVLDHFIRTLAVNSVSDFLGMEEAGHYATKCFEELDSARIHRAGQQGTEAARQHHALDNAWLCEYWGKLSLWGSWVESKYTVAARMPWGFHTNINNKHVHDFVLFLFFHFNALNRNQAWT